MNDQLEKIYVFVRNILAPKFSVNQNDAIVNEFLVELHDCNNVNANRLLICIAIDLKSYQDSRITQDEFHRLIELIRNIILGIQSNPLTAKTFEKIDLRELPHVKFAYSLSCYSEGVSCQPAKQNRESVTYGKIMDFPNYMKWVVIPNLVMDNKTVDHIHSSQYRRYYDEEFHIYSKIKIGFLSSNLKWVFIGDREEFEDDIKERNLSELLNSLGFYLSKIREDVPYICLQYPRNICEVEDFFQPTSLSGDWGKIVEENIEEGNNYFLSYKIQDRWGRTFNITGRTYRKKERIHYELNSTPTYFFTIEALDYLTNHNQNFASKKEILSDAINRFNEF